GEFGGGGGQIGRPGRDRSPTYGASIRHCQGRKRSDKARRNTATKWLSGWFVSGFDSFEAVARPHDLHHSPVIGELAVGKRHLGPGALKQRAGDEDAKPEAAAIAFIRERPARHIG